MEPWFVLWSFFLLRLLYISINLSYGLAWSAFVMSGLVLLAATWKTTKMDMQDCWSFTCCLSWILGLSSNVASLSFFYMYYFSRFSSELAQLVSLLYSHGRSTRYSDRLLDFAVTILRCDVTRMSLSTDFFLTQLDSRILLLQNAFLWPMI